MCWKSVRSSEVMNLCVSVAHLARYEHHLVKKAVHGGAMVECFLMVRRMIQVTCTADHARTPAGVVSVEMVSVRMTCEMSTLKQS